MNNTRRKNHNSVVIICYGEPEFWGSREEAINFYREGMLACEGAERNRYTNIYLQLLEGCDVCIDKPEEVE